MTDICTRFSLGGYYLDTIKREDETQYTTDLDLNL